MKRQFFTTFLSKIALKNYQFLILIPDLKSSCRDASVGVISNVLWTILILGVMGSKYNFTLILHPQAAFDFSIFAQNRVYKL